MNVYRSLTKSSPQSADKAYGDDTNTKQNYHALKQTCFATGTLFEDPLFEPPVDGELKWLRPHQFCSGPKFIADGVSRFDVEQGGLGDCWMVAAMANLTLSDEAFNRVVPQDQSFDRGLYCGLFRFNFWRFGRWVEVVIDDRLPIGHDRQPLYVHSHDRNEFWSPLLEKAYAKLYSSYGALESGDFCEAMVDFTGGLAETFKLAEAPANLWTILKKGFERGSMIGSSIRSRDIRHKMKGLVELHAYGVTNVLAIQVGNLEVPMLRLRNPWGHKEWNGRWSDKSNLWLDISESERKRIGLHVNDDGEFWMSFRDWMENFTHCEMCNLGPESVNSDLKQRWFAKAMEGGWIWGLSTGGHRTIDNATQFASNPQYFVRLTEPDPDDKAGNCTLVLSLMQRDHRLATGINPLTIGFYVYSIGQRPSSEHLSGNFFVNNHPLESEPTFTSDREVSARFHVPPGGYVIVPTTHDAGESGQFLLRLWTEHPVKCAASTRTNERLYAVPPSAPAPVANRLVEPLRSMKPARAYPAAICVSSAGNTSIRIGNGQTYIEHRANGNTTTIQYPSLFYPGKPRIVNRDIQVASSRRARINITVRSNCQGPPVKKRRGLFRRMFRKVFRSNKSKRRGQR